MVTDSSRMQFRRMDEGSDADFAILADVHRQAVHRLPDLLLQLLTDLRGDEQYPIDRLAHSLQTATRALRDGRDEEYVVCALLHDVGESLGPFNHGEVAASILRPFMGLPPLWLTSLLRGTPALEGCNHAKEIPCGVQA